MKCRLSMLIISCLFLVACSDNKGSEPEDGSNLPLQFTATIGEMQTRATANHQNTIISSGETVWLWIDRNKDQSKYIGAWQHSSDGLGKLYPVPTITRFYPTGNATINIYGIHGYFSTYIGDDDTRPDTLYHSVFNDQSVDANYLRSDLLWTNDIKQYAGDDIKLIFSHMLSKIEVCFKPVGSLTDDSIAGAKAWLVDMQQQAKINPTTGVGATLGNAKDMPIPLKTLPYSATTFSGADYAEIIVPPQKIKPRVMMKVQFTNGSTFYYRPDSTFTLEPGKVYTFNMLVKHNIKVPGTVDPWNYEDKSTQFVMEPEYLIPKVTPWNETDRYMEWNFLTPPPKVEPWVYKDGNKYTWDSLQIANGTTINPTP